MNKTNKIPFLTEFSLVGSTDKEQVITTQYVSVVTGRIQSTEPGLGVEEGFLGTAWLRSPGLERLSDMKSGQCSGQREQDTEGPEGKAACLSSYGAGQWQGSGERGCLRGERGSGQAGLVGHGKAARAHPENSRESLKGSKTGA